MIAERSLMYHLSAVFKCMHGMPEQAAVIRASRRSNVTWMHPSCIPMFEDMAQHLKRMVSIVNICFAASEAAICMVAFTWK